MSRSAHYPTLEVDGIRAFAQHLLVVVGLNDEIVCTRDVTLYLVGNFARISDDTERHSAILYEISHIVGTVVGHSKGSNLELTRLKRVSLLNYAHEVLAHLALNAVVFVYTMVYVFGGIYRNIQLITYTTHTFHMVGMVVSYQYVVYRSHR